MNQVLFLGTGPSGGVKGKGKSRRLESSALILTAKGNILIDVGRYQEQSEKINKIDVILITHGHRDAIGGIPTFKKSLKKIPLYASWQTTQIVKRRFKKISYLDFRKIMPGKTFKIFDVKITPFLVKHSIQKGFPTFGFYFEFDDQTSLVYASDVGSWNREVERIMRKADVLIIDGAMWEKKIIAHLNIKEILPKICLWENKKIIFTHIGKTAPDHETLEREIKTICPKALPAYDGLLI